MLKLAIDLVMALSLAAFLYLVARALPRIGENGEAERKNHRVIVYLERTDAILKLWSEKTLRRVRVTVMKLDNFLGKKLSRFKKDDERTGGLDFALGDAQVEETPAETVVVAEVVEETVPEPAKERKRSVRVRKEREEESAGGGAVNRTRL